MVIYYQYIFPFVKIIINMFILLECGSRTVGEKGKYQWKRKMKHTLTDEIEVFQDNTFRITGLNNISSIVFKFI